MKPLMDDLVVGAGDCISRDGHAHLTCAKIEVLSERVGYWHGATVSASRKLNTPVSLTDVFDTAFGEDDLGGLADGRRGVGGVPGTPNSAF